MSIVESQTIQAAVEEKATVTLTLAPPGEAPWARGGPGLHASPCEQIRGCHLNERAPFVHSVFIMDAFYKIASVCFFLFVLIITW